MGNMLEKRFNVFGLKFTPHLACTCDPKSVFVYPAAVALSYVIVSLLVLGGVGRIFGRPFWFMRRLVCG